MLQIIISHVLQMFILYKTCFGHMLGFVLFLTYTYYTLCSCYNLKFLEWDKGQTFILEKTQENSIESSLQSSLFYISIHIVCASYYVSYSKVLCVRYKVNMQYTYYMTSLFLKPSIFFHALCDL